MRTNTFTSLAGVALLTLGAVGGQAVSFNDTRPCLIHPKQMVNVYEDSLSITIPVGGTETIFTVPENQWLVVTNIRVSLFSGGGAFISQQGPIGLTRKGRPSTAADTPPSQAGGPVGWAFEPGTTVVLEQSGVDPSHVTAFNLTGYLMK